MGLMAADSLFREADNYNFTPLKLYTSENATKFSDISDMSFRIEPSEASNSTSIAESGTLSVVATSLFGFAAFSL